MAETVRVGGFGSRGQAELAKTYLADHGIHAEVLADDAGGTAPHVPFGAGGIALAVRPAQADEAQRLLEVPGEADPTDEVAARSTRRIAQWGVAFVLVVVILIGVVVSVMG